MDSRIANNGLEFLNRAASYIPMTAKEALAFSEFYEALLKEAQEDKKTHE